MKFYNLQVTSADALNFEFNVTSPVCVLRGRYSELALDLIRETIGDYGAKNDPDSIDDGRFVIHSDIELSGKCYSICYIRSADYLGDNRISANFVMRDKEVWLDDTREYLNKCALLSRGESNVLVGSADFPSSADRRPIFIYGCFDRLDDSIDVAPMLKKLTNLGRQVFVSVCPAYPIEKMTLDGVQTVEI